MASPYSTAAPSIPTWRRYPIGVEPTSNRRAHARVWAPKRRSVAFLRDPEHSSVATELEAEGNGYFSSMVPAAAAGTLYRFRLDGERDVPDPASRFQPTGPHGPSQIIDASSYVWGDGEWRGASIPGQVLYELHIGTFTVDGTYRAAAERLDALADVGVTVIEMMPVADFPGRFGWGYDGVDLFAPYHHYGTPDELRAFIDAAHRGGIAVILDVVYNHLGPDGNYLKEFSDHYFRGHTEWGEALNFDGDHSDAVRELYLANAAYWVEEFHFDGLRLDATQQIFDESSPHIMTEVQSRVREAARGRATIVIAENEPQHAKLVRPPRAGGYGLDALWNDDFHHSATVALTGRTEAYYSGYRGNAQELLSSAKYGFLYQGEWYEWQKGRRGAPAYDVMPFGFVNFTQNHDQIANAAAGLRAHQLSSPSRYRTLTALLLLMPQTPMLFQGQEFASSSPFLYFADYAPELATLVRRGRVEFLGQFPSIASDEMTSRLADPASVEMFNRCKLDWSERTGGEHACALTMVRDLLRLRREDDTLRHHAMRGTDGAAAAMVRSIDGAVLNDEAFFLRYFGERPELDRLVVINFGRDVRATTLAEPLVAPPDSMLWRPLWSSDDPRYGGFGTPSIEGDDGGWWLPAECVVVLAPLARDRAPAAPRHPASEKEARAQWKARHEKTAR